MTREQIMEAVAEWFGIDPNDDGKFDIDDYDWQSGCYMNHTWFNLAEVVRCIESIVEDIEG